MPPLTRLILQIYIPCFLVIMAGFSSAESARPSPIWSLDFSPDGKLLAVGIYQNVVLLDAQKWEHKDTLTGLMDGVRDLCFSENGKRLAAAGGLPTEIGEIIVWNAENWEHIVDITDLFDVVEGMDLNPAGDLVVASSTDDKVMINTVEDGELVSLIGAHVKRCYAAEFSFDGRYYATGSADRTVKVWSPKTSKLLANFSQNNGTVYDISFAPKSYNFATASADAKVRTWALTPRGDAVSGRLLRICNGHQGPVYSVDFHPDGEHMASASEDGTVIYWEVISGNVLLRLRKSIGPVYAVAISPDGKSIASGGRDGKLRIWNTKTGKMDAELVPPLPSEDSDQEAAAAKIAEDEEG